jgi:aspartyl protease family protein
MTTGFMARIRVLSSCSVAALLACAGAADAADIAVTALFSGKAVIVVDGGKPRTLSAGQSTPEGVRLVTATSESAVIEYEGKRQTLRLGEGTRVGSSAAGSGAAQVTLPVGPGGHFYANGAINGVAVRFLVDTGASAVGLSGDAARRLGINFLNGQPGMVGTASGRIKAYRVTLDSVRVGDITLNNVTADVIEGSYPQEILLGMSFLSRTQMKRDGDILTLVRRY